MKYPFTPELLDALPESLAELFRELEITLLEAICSRIKAAGQLNEVTVQAIRALRAQGIELAEIERAIRDVTGMSAQELDKLFDDVVERNQQYYSRLIDKASVTLPEQIVSPSDIEAIRRQTQDAFTNITQSMGFLIRQGGRTVMLPPAKAYQWALDSAALQIETGAIDYNTAIRDAVRKLADGGIKTVRYESGHADHIDVAVRRAVMTGIAQLSDRYTEETAEILETELFEVSAHRGARDVGTGPMNHKSWQGKVYSARDDDPKYPSIYEVCGLGTGEGLEGWNCRHRRFAFVEGISDRTYTDEELENIDLPPFEFEGRTYTMYEATQKQREIERTIRKLRRRQAAEKAAGLTEDATATGARIRRLRKEYKAFSKAAQLPEQLERARGYDSELTNKKSRGIISGGTSGALSPNSARAQEHATRYYDAVRKMTTDVSAVAKNSGFDESEIETIKKFIFYDKHDLGDGTIARFAPSYEMAESWQRLVDGKNIQHHDIILLKHEMLEKALIDSGLSQEEAHIEATKKYNYAKEAQKYYDSNKKHSKT